MISLRHFAAFQLLSVLFLFGISNAHAQPTIDFTRDVQPILQRRCWKCHSEDRADGGLRLDERKFAEQGGGSGKNVLENEGARNELLRRVKAANVEERMPPEGPALSEQEITTLARWIAQGAVWPARLQPRSADDTWQQRWLTRWERMLSPRYIPVWIMLIVVLALMFVLERINARRTNRFSRAWHVVGLLGVALLATVQYAHEQSDLRSGKSTPGDHSASSFAAEENRKGIYEPYRPLHPRRLGGIYYRGNDERSDELYNGGFYRTATFQIHLTDASGEPLAWGDPLPDQPHLRFDIRRSPHTSPALFAGNIMHHVGLSEVQPEQLRAAADPPFTMLKEEEPGERWSVLFPLAAIPPQGKISGKVYVYTAVGSGTAKNSAQPWYLIGYELAASDGTIAKSSQIWMASVRNVAGMLRPEPGRIPADEWFDFRPIPEIEKPE